MANANQEMRFTLKQYGGKIMITLFRWILLKQKEVKWKLAFWQFLDKQAMELIKNPEELEKKFIDSFAKLIHEANGKAET